MRELALLVTVLFVAACDQTAAGTPLSCEARTDCAGGTLLGTISGDQGAATVSADGLTSAWVLVRVTEDVSDVNGRPLHLSATLASPSGTSFDLYAYAATKTPDGGTPPEPTTVDCTDLVAQATQPGNSKTLELTWGEQLGQTANGLEDGRTVAFEIRHASGSCGGDARWTLTVRGN
jgi:hypothetical protein